LDIHVSTVSDYLKKYNNKNYNKKHKIQPKYKILCLYDNKMYDNVDEATIYYGFKYKNYIYSCCNGRYKSVYSHIFNKYISFKYIDKFKFLNNN
jgi:hypothetical protein